MRLLKFLEVVKYAFCTFSVSSHSYEIQSQSQSQSYDKTSVHFTEIIKCREFHHHNSVLCEKIFLELRENV